MLVEDLRTERANGVVTFLATIRWEENQRDPVDVSFAVREEDEWRASLSPDAFRVPAAVVARHDNEERLSGGGPICAVLRNGLADSLEWLARWSGNGQRRPFLEIPVGCVHPAPTGIGKSALLVSGGVDSTAVLVANHDAYDPDHPLRISTGIVIVGIQSSRWTAWTSSKDRLDGARQDLSWIEGNGDVELVPVATNIRELNRGGTFWKYEFQGAALAGVGHLFSNSISNLSIASTWEIRNLDRWGSHPLLDPGYGSHSLRIWHEMASVGRLDKTRLIASSSSLLGGLNVCNKAEAGDQNCGRCEKCLRTMLALEALGSLEQGPVFVNASIDLRDLEQIRVLDRGLEGEYVELIEPLERVGRHDLASLVRKKVRQGRFLRKSFAGSVRGLGSRILPRTFRERYLGVRKIPR